MKTASRQEPAEQMLRGLLDRIGGCADDIAVRGIYEDDEKR